jgi:hypothetical protein
MKVYVNENPVQVFPGATVKAALIRAGVLEEIERGKKVYDGWGNEVGLDGALSEGMKLSLR